MEEALTIIVIYQIAVLILSTLVGLMLGIIDDITIEDMGVANALVSFTLLIILGIILILYKVGL